MLGLFGYNQGTLKNIKLDNFNIAGNDYVGGLASYNLGNIVNCEISQNSIIGGHDCVGGLVRIYNRKYNSKHIKCSC